MSRPERRRRLLILHGAEGLLHHDAVGAAGSPLGRRPYRRGIRHGHHLSGEVDGQTVTTDKVVNYPATTR